MSVSKLAHTVSIRSMEKLRLELEDEFESAGVPLVRYVIGRWSGGQKVIADEPSPSNVKAAQ